MRLLRKKQRGFSAIIAVILVILLALIGAYMSTLTSVGSINTTVSAGTMQAWYAARSGIEWAVRDLIVGSGTCSSPTINLTGGNTNGFTVRLTCSSGAYTEAGVGTYNVYALTSRATRGDPGDLAYVSRQINLSVTDAP
jgi:MSHA biogenesis protein MshP